MDGSSRRIDLNLYLNNNYNNNGDDHDNNMNNNSGPSDYDVPMEGIPVAALDCSGHSFMSLLLQPSPLRSTPDLNLSLHHGQNNVYPNSSGSELGWNDHQVVSQGLDYMHGPSQSNPYGLSHISPSNLGSFPREIPYGNANSVGPHYYEPEEMMEDLVPYSSSQLAPFDCVGYGYPPNFHYSATSGTAAFEQGGSGQPAVEEIMFGGRVIQATRVDLTPATPTFVTEQGTTIALPPMDDNPTGPAPEELILAHLEAVGAIQGSSGRPTFLGADSSITAARQNVRPSNRIPSWLNGNRDPQDYMDLPRRRTDSMEVDGFDFEDDIYVDIQDWAYEALIALQELLGNGRGLKEHEIQDVLERKIFRQHSADAGGTTCCSICLDEYKEEQQLGVLNCSHDFHFDCIKEWLRRKNSCPLCRETF